MNNLYQQIREQYPEALLLFRQTNDQVDIYEAYDKDAEFVANIIGSPIEQSNYKELGVNLVVGFPFYNLDKYLPLFVRAGKRVCICDSIIDKSKPTETAEPTFSDLNRDEDFIFNRCLANAKAYNEEGGFCIEECDFGSYTKKQVSGYFSQLTQKGYIQEVEDCYFSHYICKKHWKEED